MEEKESKFSKEQKQVLILIVAILIISVSMLFIINGKNEESIIENEVSNQVVEENTLFEETLANKINEEFGFEDIENIIEDSSKMDAPEMNPEDGELKLEKYIIDGDNLILNFKLKLKQKEELLVKECYEWETTIAYDNNIVNIDAYKKFGVFEKINDTEYSIYRFYTIEPEKAKEDITLNTRINIIKYDKEEYENPKDGEPDATNVVDMNFKLDLKKSEFNGEYKKYKVDNMVKDLELLHEKEEGKTYNLSSVKLKSVTQSEKLTKFEMELLNYSSNCVYFVEILDENNNVILEKGMQFFTGNLYAETLTNRIKDNSKIKIIVYECSRGDSLEIYTMGDEIYSKAIIELDMEKDLILEK